MSRSVDGDLIVITGGEGNGRTRHATERAGLAIDRKSAKAGISNLHPGAERGNIQHINEAPLSVSSNLEQVRLPHALIERSARHRGYCAVVAVDGSRLHAAGFQARPSENNAA